MSFTNQTVQVMQNTVETVHNLLECEYSMSGWTLGLLIGVYIALFTGYFSLCFSTWNDRDLIYRLRRALHSLRPQKTSKLFDELENVRANLAIGLQVLTNFAEMAHYDREDVESHLDDLDDVLTYCRAILPQLKGDQAFYRKMVDSVALRSREIHLENLRDDVSEKSDMEDTDQEVCEDREVDEPEEKDSPATRTRSKVKNH